MFETSCNLVAIWRKPEINMAHQSGPNCIGIAAIYTCNKSCNKSATKIASKIACVNEPLDSSYFYTSPRFLLLNSTDYFEAL